MTWRGRWEQNPAVIEACRSHRLPGDPTDYTGPRRVGRTPDDRTSFKPGQANWHKENLPEILYQLNPPQSWREVKDKKAPNLLDANGATVKEPEPDDPENPRDMKDLPILPNRIGSQEEEWYFEAIRRLDPRVRWVDFIMRMKKEYRPVTNALQWRLSRGWREALALKSWHLTSDRGKTGLELANNRIDAGLSQRQRDNNTTRGTTPGYIDPQIQDRGRNNENWVEWPKGRTGKDWGIAVKTKFGRRKRKDANTKRNASQQTFTSGFSAPSSSTGATGTGTLSAMSNITSSDFVRPPVSNQVGPYGYDPALEAAAFLAYSASPYPRSGSSMPEIPLSTSNLGLLLNSAQYQASLHQSTPHVSRTGRRAFVQLDNQGSSSNIPSNRIPIDAATGLSRQNLHLQTGLRPSGTGYDTRRRSTPATGATLPKRVMDNSDVEDASASVPSGPQPAKRRRLLPPDPSPSQLNYPSQNAFASRHQAPSVQVSRTSNQEALQSRPRVPIYPERQAFSGPVQVQSRPTTREAFLQQCPYTNPYRSDSGYQSMETPTGYVTRPASANLEPWTTTSEPLRTQTLQPASHTPSVQQPSGTRVRSPTLTEPRCVISHYDSSGMPVFSDLYEGEDDGFFFDFEF